MLRLEEGLKALNDHWMTVITWALCPVPERPASGGRAMPHGMAFARWSLRPGRGFN
jgi:hypothetical protein